jgi:predicted  nucleic acid-binding Zn-ribbon protein
MQERIVPGLFGQPLKNRLRKEIHQLRTDLWNLRKEHGNALHSLKYTQSKVEELEAKLKRIKNAAGGIIADIDEDVRPAVFERYKKRIFGR